MAEKPQSKPPTLPPGLRKPAVVVPSASAPANAAKPDSSELVTRLVQRAMEAGELDHYEGKRQWRRFRAGLQLEATVDPSNPRGIMSVLMHDVSGGGAAFWCKQGLELHQTVYLRDWTEAGASDWVAGRVAHVTGGLRGYLIGIRFDNPLPPETFVG